MQNEHFSTEDSGALQLVDMLVGLVFKDGEISYNLWEKPKTED